MSRVSHSFLITIVISLSVLSLGFNQQSCQVRKDPHVGLGQNKDQSFNLEQDCENFYSEKHINIMKSKVYPISEDALKIEAKQNREECQRYCESTYKENEDLIFACQVGQQLFFNDYQRVLTEHWKQLRTYKAQASGFAANPSAEAEDDTKSNTFAYQKENDSLLNLVSRVMGRQAVSDQCLNVAAQSGSEKNQYAIAGACETGFSEESSRANQFLPYWPEGQDMGSRESGNGSPK